MTEVVAALIFKGDKFLICRRPPNKKRGLLWEFVGGKVEEGETKEQALERECLEELGIKVKVGREFAQTSHTYDDISVHITLFEAEIEEGEPQLLEHTRLEWIGRGETENYEFCPADKIFLDLLKKT